MYDVSRSLVITSQSNKILNPKNKIGYASTSVCAIIPTFEEPTSKNVSSPTNSLS